MRRATQIAPMVNSPPSATAALQCSHNRIVNPSVAMTQALRRSRGPGGECGTEAVGVGNELSGETTWLGLSVGLDRES